MAKRLFSKKVLLACVRIAVAMRHVVLYFFTATSRPGSIFHRKNVESAAVNLSSKGDFDGCEKQTGQDRERSRWPWTHYGVHYDRNSGGLDLFAFELTAYSRTEKSVRKPVTFKLPKLTKRQREYLERLKESELNPDLNIRFGPGPRKRSLEFVFDPNKIRNISTVRACSHSVYLTCPEPVADDVHAELTWAANEIYRLTAERDRWMIKAFVALASD